MRSKKKNDFEVLVGRIQATSDALQQDALVVINRSVTTRAWLTGYYIVEYEQHGADRAKYGTGLLKKLAARLNNSNFALPSLKNYRAFYKVYPEVGLEVAAYLRERFGKGYTACSLLVDAPTLALPDKSYTACSQSSPNGLLVEYGDEIRISAEARARAAYRRKQRQGARYRSKRFPPTSRNRRGRNGRKSCARSSAASRGCDRMR